MSKNVSRIIAAVMLAVAVGFIAYSLSHPEAAFPWSNTVTYIIYGVYALITIVLFIAPLKNKQK